MQIVDGMLVIYENCISSKHLFKDKAAGITDDGAPTTEKQMVKVRM